LAIPDRGTHRFDVAGFGLNSIDLLTVVAEFPSSNSKQRLQRFARMPGGQIATALVTCTKLGCTTSYVGSFGDDDFGRSARENLVRRIRGSHRDRRDQSVRGRAGRRADR
jgi:sugar/nucleoside kinase (ribokinase family)